MSLAGNHRQYERRFIVCVLYLFEISFNVVLNKLSSSMINALSEEVMRKSGHGRSHSPRVLSQVD